MTRTKGQSKRLGPRYMPSTGRKEAETQARAFRGKMPVMRLQRGDRTEPSVNPPIDAQSPTNMFIRLEALAVEVTTIRRMLEEYLVPSEKKGRYRGSVDHLTRS